MKKKLGFVAGLEIELPNRKAVLGERKAVALETERIQAEQVSVEKELKAVLNELIGRCETSRRIALDVRNQILPSSLQILELTLEAYRLGKANQLMVLDAQKSVHENWRVYFEALGELYGALNAMEKMCGFCLVQEHHGN